MEENNCMDISRNKRNLKQEDIDMAKKKKP